MSRTLLPLLVIAVGLVFALAACSDDAVQIGQPCQTDGDCNGGLCQGGQCIPASGDPLEADTGGGDAPAVPDLDGDDGTVVADTDDGGEEVSDEAGDDVPDEAGVDVSDEAGEENACGGTHPLEAELGASCGVCDDGEVVCDGSDATRCNGASEANICGGCGPLPGIPGTVCDECDGGVWHCTSSGELGCVCDGGVEGTCESPLPIEVGDVVTVDLCGSGDDEDPIAGPVDCPDVSIRGQEVVYTFTLEEASAVVVDLRDADDTVAVDTVAYLRSTCADAASQLICRDDVPCQESDLDDPCTGAEQVRQSRFRAELEAGTYFLVADSFTYSQNGVNYGCGTVQLTVRSAVQ